MNTAEKIENIQSNVVLSRAVPIEQLEVGMVCAENVKLATGPVLISMNTRLEQKHLDFLRNADVNKVEVISDKKVDVKLYEEPIHGKSVKNNLPVKKIRVLIVDDSDFMRKVLKLMLNKIDEIDVQVVGEAVDGREALFMARFHEPDVVIMDILMPVMDGITAVKELSALFPKMKFIMLSTAASKNTISESICSGATDYIQKPFNPERVKKALISVMADNK